MFKWPKQKPNNPVNYLYLFHHWKTRCTCQKRPLCIFIQSLVVLRAIVILQNQQPICFSSPTKCKCISWHNIIKKLEDTDLEPVTTERLRATDWNPSVSSQELARKMTTQRGHVSDRAVSMSGDHEKRQNPADVQPATVNKYTQQVSDASYSHLWLRRLPLYMVMTRRGEAQVITLPAPSSLCNRSLALPKNRQSSGCTSSSSLTAQPLQTIPFVKLFQGEPSLQILHSAPSAGSKNVPLSLSERVHRLGNEAELGWGRFLRKGDYIVISTSLGVIGLQRK